MNSLVKMLVVIAIVIGVIAGVYHFSEQEKLAAAKVKIGFVTTITTPAGVIGKDMVDAVNLAMEDIAGPMASYGNVDAVNMATEYLIGVGRQIAVVMCSPVKTDATVGFATRT